MNHPNFKDCCDLCAAVLNSKIRREVNTGFDIETPRDQAEAIVRGDGVANCIVFIGPILGEQRPLKVKKIKNISKIHDFKFTDDGVIVKRVCDIGKGKHIKLDKLEITVKFDYEVYNLKQLENGRPIKKTKNPFQKGKKSNVNDPQKSGDASTSRKLNMMEYVRQNYADALSLEKIKKFQPSFEIGGKLLREKLDEPVFTETLMALATGTKWSAKDWTLKDLEVGHALPEWGGGKNTRTAKANAYLQELFDKGIDGKAILASEAVVMMQEKIDPETNLPLFTADEFLDEDQIAGFFTTHAARSKKAGGSGGKRKGASTSNQGPPEKIPHLDYEEVDNTEEKQEVEESIQDMQAAEYSAAMERDAARIKKVLSNTSDSAECPLRVSGINLCEMAELIIAMVGNPVQNLTFDQKRAIIDKVEPDEAKRNNLVKNNRMLTKKIANYVKTECPQKCCALTWYQ